MHTKQHPCDKNDALNCGSCSTTVESEGWEERIKGYMASAAPDDSPYLNVISEVRQTSTTVRREERERVVEILEEMKEELNAGNFRWVDDHNQALSDAITAIKGEEV